MVGDKLDKNIVILSNIPLSNKTGAGYSRIIQYAKGLAYFESNIVYLASLSHLNHSKKQFIDKNERIILLGEKKERKYHFQVDRIFGFKERINSLNEIIEITTSNNCKTVFLLYPFFNTFYEELYYIKKLKKLKFKVYSERNELSLGITLNSTIPQKIHKKILFALFQPFEIINSFIQDNLVSKYDGNIVISSKFERWIKSKNKNFIRIPILAGLNDVHIKRNIDKQINGGFFNIGYTGSINFKKDGLNKLLESMYILIYKYKKKNIILNIFGYGNTNEINKLKNTISKLKLTNNVIYKGYIAHSKINEVLHSQNLLVLIRNSGLQTNFGFSTKLAEYISSGTPVLLTRVSDNDHFLIDEKSAFFVDYDENEISKSIIKIIHLDNNFINKISNEAYFVFKNNFTIDKYRDQLNKFLE